jgi:hypothetical protein
MRVFHALRFLFKFSSSYFISIGLSSEFLIIILSELSFLSSGPVLLCTVQPWP